jgi:peroxiredoxin
MKNSFALWVVVASVLLRFGEAAGQSTGEKQFKALRERFLAESEAYETAVRSLKTDDERAAFAREHYPGNTLVGEFVALEEHCRGTLAGFSALYHLVAQPSRGGAPDWPAQEGRQQGLKLLAQHYANHPDLDLIFGWLAYGDRGPEDKPFLRRAAESGHRHVRGTALLALARLFAIEAKVPVWFDANLELLQERPETFAAEIKLYRELRSRWADVDPAVSRNEALQLSDRVAAEYADIVESRQTGYGPALIEVKREPTAGGKSRPVLGELAEALRFELTHLLIGQAAPEITGPEASGKELKLSEQRGKATVIMFSFTGCGPCEAMYPANRKLVETYAGRPLAFLGVMGDELATVKKAVERRTITWPVWWDGTAPGPIASRWSVKKWPEIYVLDHRGIIRYREIQGVVLERAIAKLVNEAERGR